MDSMTRVDCTWENTDTTVFFSLNKQHPSDSAIRIFGKLNRLTTKAVSVYLLALWRSVTHEACAAVRTVVGRAGCNKREMRVQLSPSTIVAGPGTKWEVLSVVTHFSYFPSGQRQNHF